MPRITSDGDLFNAMFPKSINSNENMESKSTNWPDAPEHLRELLDVFTDSTDIAPRTKMDRRYQVKEAEGFYGEHGNDIELLKSSISKMKSINYNISSIGSLRKTARGLKVKKKEETHEERQKYLKGWFD